MDRKRSAQWPEAALSNALQPKAALSNAAQIASSPVRNPSEVGLLAGPIFDFFKTFQLLRNLNAYTQIFLNLPFEQCPSFNKSPFLILVRSCSAPLVEPLEIRPTVFVLNRIPKS